jgi:hypothetical protein
LVQDARGALTVEVAGRQANREIEFSRGQARPLSGGELPLSGGELPLSGGKEDVMSAPILNGTDDRLLPTPTMYAPPWAREEARGAAVGAAEAALAASEEFRRTLPPAPLLGERRRRDRPFEGDLAVARLRERPSLDPVVMPPPLDARGSPVGLLARVVGAIGLAALAAFFTVGTMPLKGAVKAEAETTLPSWWSRFAAPGDARERPSVPPAANEEPVTLADRFATPEPIPVRAVPTTPVQVAAVLPEAPPAAPPAQPAETRLRVLDRDEIATLYRRSEQLIGQGDIAGARLLLTRAAEAGDARSALALGATYDAANLGRLGVRGIAPDAAQAQAWYAKAAEFGSSEASRRLEQFAQSVR